ncbi:MAG: IS1595 family transposase [Stellaceae bacterium]
MAAAELQNPIFQNETKAREWIEARIWPDGPVCPHCGVLNASTKLEGEAHRAGLYQCNECREQFTATVGTLFERSKLPLNKWVMALYLLMASKKGFSAHQASRMLNVSYKSTWFMMHRLREALREGNFPFPLGGKGKTVEMDETFVGGKEKNKHRSKRKHVGTGGAGKEAVFSLVEREGKVRSFHVPAVSANTLRPILVSQVDRGSYIMTDESAPAKMLGREFGRHQSVNHSIGEYVRGDAHTNTIEGYFSIMKRGINGVYHHVSQQHLKRYLAEYDFRYNERMALGVSDMKRTEKAIKGILGKRLTYRRTGTEA